MRKAPWNGGGSCVKYRCRRNNVLLYKYIRTEGEKYKI